MNNQNQSFFRKYKTALRDLIILLVAVVLALIYHYAPVYYPAFYYYIEMALNPVEHFPSIPLGSYVETGIEWLIENIDYITRAIADFIETCMEEISETLLWFPSFVLAILFSLVAWRFSGYQVALFSFVGLTLIKNMGYWEPAIDTLSMVVVSVAISILIGLPIGILSARSDIIQRIVWPILDFMQTMPAFIYLIPAVFFFSTGVVGGMVATIIFSMPPVIRLTGLGIRQVSQEVVEACIAFGSTNWQKLVKVQVPLAMPTIMAGVNQCIMLALSMVVIASMIGAGGLGDLVRRAVSRVNIDLGFESGISIVILAIILDRITQSSTGSSNDEE